MKNSNESSFDFSIERIREIAKEHEGLRDELLITEADFEPYMYLAARFLVSSFRALKAIEAKGIPFQAMTAEFLVEYLKKGEAAIEEWKHRNGT